jgi:hypothetical protein
MFCSFTRFSLHARRSYARRSSSICRFSPLCR